MHIYYRYHSNFRDCFLLMVIYELPTRTVISSRDFLLYMFYTEFSPQRGRKYLTESLIIVKIEEYPERVCYKEQIR